MRYLLALLTLLALALAHAALAAGTPVKVTADNFTIDQTSGQATFTGNVVIVRSDLNMWADKVVVRYGTGGPGDIDALEATGHVRIKTTGQEATGQRAVFDPDSSILRLTDDVTVVSEQGTVKGPELVINLATDNSVFKSNGGSRVTGVFTPQ